MKKAKQGYVTVEAAVILPVFIVAVLTLGFLIRAVSLEETLFHSLVNQSRRLSAEGSFHSLDLSQLPEGLEAVLDSAAGIQSSAAVFQNRLGRQLAEEGYKDGVCHIAEYRYRYAAGEIDELIRVRAGIQVSIPLPAMFRKDYKSQQQMVFRSFAGTERKGGTVSHEELETDGDGQFVWVFPRAGERYHQENCSVINVMAREQVLTKTIIRQHDPCKLCKPDPKAVGSLVYGFPSAGSSYHRQDCHSVNRYVERMEREDAKQRGYTPCKVCGG